MTSHIAESPQAKRVIAWAIRLAAVVIVAVMARRYSDARWHPEGHPWLAITTLLNATGLIGISFRWSDSPHRRTAVVIALLAVLLSFALSQTFLSHA
jgi:hypothetical protein